MKVIRSPERMYEFSQRKIRLGRTIGFVPTMGALHEGHLSLIRAAHRENDSVVVSIFVNPTQFAPQEDFKKYPRDFSRDSLLCKREGVEVIFSPGYKQMYPANYKTFVTVEDLSNLLCGKSRPGHFRGVATVVTKLFNIVSPSRAYFGQKDAQQAVIIKKMASDLNMPVKIKVMPIIRDKDGLALSSRNAYLSEEERQDALVLSEALSLAKDLIQAGVRDTRIIIARMRRLIRQKKSAKIDYIQVVEPENLTPAKKLRNNCIIALAVWVGRTRLIDNAVVKIK